MLAVSQHGPILLHTIVVANGGPRDRFDTEDKVDTLQFHARERSASLSLLQLNGRVDFRILHVEHSVRNTLGPPEAVDWDPLEQSTVIPFFWNAPRSVEYQRSLEVRRNTHATVDQISE